MKQHEIDDAVKDNALDEQYIAQAYIKIEYYVEKHWGIFYKIAIVVWHPLRSLSYSHNALIL